MASATHRRHRRATNDSRDTWTEERTFAYWKALDKEAAKHSDTVSAALATFFETWSDAYLKDVPAKKYEPPTGDTYDAVTGALHRSIEADFRRAVTDAGMTWSDVADGLRDAIRQAEADADAAVNGSIDVARDELNRIRVESTDIADLRVALGTKFQHYAGARAQMIAQTLVTAGRTRAQRSTWDAISAATGRVITPVWVSQRDALVRESHYLADGIRPNVNDGKFHIVGHFGPVLMDGPGVGPVVEEVVNCRCVLRPG